jgi:hypothetical protein
VPGGEEALDVARLELDVVSLRAITDLVIFILLL